MIGGTLDHRWRNGVLCSAGQAWFPLGRRTGRWTEKGTRPLLLHHRRTGISHLVLGRETRTVHRRERTSLQCDEHTMLQVRAGMRMSLLELELMHLRVAPEAGLLDSVLVSGLPMTVLSVETVGR